MSKLRFTSSQFSLLFNVRFRYHLKELLCGSSDSGPLVLLNNSPITLYFLKKKNKMIVAQERLIPIFKC